MRVSNRTLALSLVIGVMILCGCLAIYFFSAPSLPAPVRSEQEPAEIEPAAPLPVATSIALDLTAQPGIPERRRLTLEFPPRIRAGDGDVVRLTLEVDDLHRLTPTAQFNGGAISANAVETPNLYDTHQVIAEARLDLAGVEVRPPELVSASLSPGTAVTFQWNIRPVDAGAYRGTIWLYLRFVDRQTGEESRKMISAQWVEVQAVKVWGLSGELARTTGIIGSILGAFVALPFFEDALHFLWKRRNKIHPRIHDEYHPKIGMD